MYPDINLKDFKLVVSDLDGTIKDSEQPITPYTLETFSKLDELGIHFTLASGRNLASLRVYAEELNVRVPMVLANGCIVQSLNGEVHHHEYLPPEVTKQLFEITERENSDMMVFVNEQLYFKRMTPNIDRIFGRIPDDVTETDSWEMMGDRVSFNPHVLQYNPS